MSEKITGKAVGGKARAKALDPNKRAEIAKKASMARWDDSMPRATHGKEDHPLTIGDIKIPCYVLSDGRRVLVQRSMASAIGISHSGGQRISSFAAGKLLSAFISPSLLEGLNTPIIFKTPQGITAHGYDATILVDICDAVLAARNAGKLLEQQLPIATQCETLVRGFAKVGIIALIDEATGYQEDRAKNALAKILEAFVAKELQPWVKKFPSSFYKEMFRLRGLEFSPETVRRPLYFGHLTNDIIYRRLAPGVWKELKTRAEKDEKGRLKHKLHQRLTPDIGDPRLRDLITAVTTIMRLSNKWNDFKEKLDDLYPPSEGAMQMPIELEHDSGEGF